MNATVRMIKRDDFVSKKKVKEKESYDLEDSQISSQEYS